MDGMTVVRQIPQEFLTKVGTGEYTACGGVIRDVSSGRIVGHLQFSGSEAMQSLLAPLQSLLHATVALNAMNLAVSVAGFAMVLSKLNEISGKLDYISEKLNCILDTLWRMEWQEEMERRSHIAALLRILAMGLRMSNDHFINQALVDLAKSAEFYRSTSQKLLADVKQVYFEPLPFRHCTEIAISTSLVQAHALALQRHPGEAVMLLADLKTWQIAAQQTLEKPLNMPRPSIWFGKISSKAREECRELIQWQRQVPEGLDYTQNQYQLCIDYGITFDDLGKLTEDAPLALLIPAGKGG
jgi:hypothetical protein